MKIIRERLYENRAEEGKATLKEKHIHGITVKLLSFVRTTQVSTFKATQVYELYVQVLDRDKVASFEVENQQHGERVLSDLEMAIDFRRKQRLIGQYSDAFDALT
jgi:hypothetical protein